MSEDSAKTDEQKLASESKPEEEKVSVEKPNNNEKKPKTERKRVRRGNKKRLFIFGAIALAIIGIIIAIICIINSNKEISIFKTDAFFIPENDKADARYALFKNNGDKLTDFEFRSVSSFVDGYAMVKNTEEQYGIIDHNGNMTVEFGKYDSIFPHVGIYEVKNGETETLILGNGNELAKDYDSYTYSSGAPYAAVKFADNHYKLFNAFGNTIAEFDSEDIPRFSDDTGETVSAVIYKGGMYILNNKNCKDATAVKTDTAYSIDEATEDGKTVVFLENKTKGSRKRAIYANSKFTEFGDKCSDIELYDNFPNKERFYLTCTTDKKELLIRNNEITDINISAQGGTYAVYDENHYVKYDSKGKKAIFFVDGQEKASVETGTNRPIAVFKGYLVRNNKDNFVALYDLDGTKIFTLSDTISGEINGVDKNDKIIVRDAGLEGNQKYYIVNKNGDTISDKYSTITVRGEYYSAHNYKDGTAALLDKDCKTIVSGDYIAFDYYDDEKVILGKKNNLEYDLIDADNKNVKASIKGAVSYYRAGYLRAYNDGKTSFYTTEGRLIHEYSK